MAVSWANDRSVLELDLRRRRRANQCWRLRSFARADRRPRQDSGRLVGGGARPSRERPGRGGEGDRCAADEAPQRADRNHRTDENGQCDQQQSVDGALTNCCAATPAWAVAQKEPSDFNCQRECRNSSRHRPRTSGSAKFHCTSGRRITLAQQGRSLCWAATWQQNGVEPRGPRIGVDGQLGCFTDESLPGIEVGRCYHGQHRDASLQEGQQFGNEASVRRFKRPKSIADDQIRLSVKRIA